MFIGLIILLGVITIIVGVRKYFEYLELRDEINKTNRRETNKAKNNKTWDTLVSYKDVRQRKVLQNAADGHSYFSYNEVKKP
jgi:hypothetical protein